MEASLEVFLGPKTENNLNLAIIYIIIKDDLKNRSIICIYYIG